jgi:DNA polymerase (family 10)
MLDGRQREQVRDPRYRRAAEQIANLDRDINSIAQAGELRSIPGIGQAIADKITSLLNTGSFDLLDRMKQTIPAGVVEMLAVPDMGPKRVKMLWEQAGITNIAELEQAAREGKLAGLPGIGPKMEAKIIANIDVTKKRGATDRTPLGIAYPLAYAMLKRLMYVDGVLRASVAGSLRRMKETIGDLDLLVAPEEAEPVMKVFVGLPQVAEVIARGPTKSSVRHTGQQVDARDSTQTLGRGAAILYRFERSQRAPARDRLEERLFAQRVFADAREGRQGFLLPRRARGVRETRSALHSGGIA